jgi:hypothetical protein
MNYKIIKKKIKYINIYIYIRILYIFDILKLVRNRGMHVF